MLSMPAKKRVQDDLLLRSIVLTAIGLAVLDAAIAFSWRPAPVLPVLPWYAPLMISLTTLAALGIAFLAFGRYRVLREPAPFWVGLAFSSYAVLSVSMFSRFRAFFRTSKG